MALNSKAEYVRSHPGTAGMPSLALRPSAGPATPALSGG